MLKTSGTVCLKHHTTSLAIKVTDEMLQAKNRNNR